jgi:hypothetical protein
MITVPILSIFFQEPSHAGYGSESCGIEKLEDVSWISHKQDARNIQKDADNLNSDMNKAIDKYKELNGKKDK